MRALTRYVFAAAGAVFVGAALLAAPSATASSIPWQMDPGDTLGPGASIASQQNDYVLVMQGDGNLVEYAPHSVVVASTNTQGHPGTVLFMQRDGNLVLRAPGNIPIWASATDRHPGTVLQVQSDGALVLYAPGHQALRVLVPPTDYVPTPAPGPELGYVDTPRPGPPVGSTGDDGEISDAHDSWELVHSNLYGGDYVNMPGRPVNPGEDFIDVEVLPF